jgi:predicted RNase H-like HicB family nuclease
LKYTVVFEKAPDNYAAYVPDLPGCVATGSTRDEVERNIREAVAFHVEGLKAEELSVPEPTAWTEVVEVS